MIDYVEIRNANTDLIGFIDTAQSIIWHSVYFGVGDFEIHTKATPQALEMLKKFNYVTRPNEIEIGIIESVRIVNDKIEGKMITAAGRFAKSILDRRIIYALTGVVNRATILRGNVEANIRALVTYNAISCPFDAKRNISILELGAVSGFPAVIVDENGAAAQKQVSYENLLEYTDKVLQEYGLASIVFLDTARKKLKFTVYAGVDRSVNNTIDAPPVIFSQQFDNLISSNYTVNTVTEKNTALIGGEGEGIARFYALFTGNERDLTRRETFVDASSITKTYKDENEVEHTYTNAEYLTVLKQKGKQELQLLKVEESFSGVIDIVNGNYVYNRDFYLGDIVTIEDTDLKQYINARITEITEVQDENGYTVEAIYQT